MIARAITVAASLILGHGAGVLPPQTSELDFVPVAVRYEASGDARRRTSDLEAIQRARFNAAAGPINPVAEVTPIVRLDRPFIASAPLTVRASELGVVPITASTRADEVRETAWTLLGRGAHGIVFENWTTLQQNDAALAEASAFAEAISRNMALYAPLRWVVKSGPRAVSIAGGQDHVEAQWLESADALLLIAVNHGAEARPVTFTFAAEIPEAIWQNMLTGGAVNFVAGPNGPFYEHTFPAHDVLVLMIRKRWK